MGYRGSKSLRDLLRGLVNVKEQRVDGYAIGYYPLDRKITD